jgi:hypothetical protein
MRPGVTIALSAADRRRLEAIVGNRNAPQKHAWRAEIVLLSATGFGTVEIIRRTGKSKTCIWRWQKRWPAPGSNLASCPFPVGVAKLTLEHLSGLLAGQLLGKFYDLRDFETSDPLSQELTHTLR